MRILGLTCLCVTFVLWGISVEGKRKKRHPIWNLRSCRQVSLSELTLANPNIYKLEGKKLAVWARFKGSDGTTLEVEGGTSVIFLLKTSSARKAALQKGLRNILIFGKIDFAEGLRFFVFHLERAPSFLQIFVERWEELEQKNAPPEDWYRLGTWALQKGIEDKDKRLIQGAFRCYQKCFEAIESTLDPENPNHVEMYVKLIKDMQRINLRFHKLGHSKLQIPRQKIYELVQVVLRYQPARLDIRNVLFELNYFPYKGRFRPYAEFKRLEGFRFYKGIVKKYHGKWVDPLLYKLLKAAEARLEQLSTLRLPPSKYEAALRKRVLLLGMTRAEILQVAGYPKLVLRTVLRKFDRDAGIEIPTTYEIWVYGDKEDEFLCIEEGSLFYFPPTFASYRE